jgi:hypothetical protein
MALRSLLIHGARFREHFVLPFSVRMLRSLFRASAVGLVCIVSLLMKLIAHFVFLGIVSFVVMLCILD